MDEKVIETVIKEFPTIGLVVLILYGIYKACKTIVTNLIKTYNEYNNQNETKAHSLQEEYKKYGHTEAERNVYKTNYEELKASYDKQETRINTLDKQILILTEESRKSGDRLDRLIKVHEDLADNYKEMNNSLQSTVKELGSSLNVYIRNSEKTNKKIEKIENEVSIIKSDIKVIKQRHDNDEQ